MSLVVSDTNVFVALFKSDLLMKVFSNTRVSVTIPTKIYEELTLPQHRVCREYPALTQLITNLVHNPNHGHPVVLRVLSNIHVINNLAALEAHFALEEDASLDKGEREAIPLAIELSAIFLSCDGDAISEFNALADKNGSSAFLFTNYCQQLFQLGQLTKAELDLILNAIRG